VYNYNTMEKVKAWEAHMDYIRYVEVHPSLPYVIRCVACVARVAAWLVVWARLVEEGGRAAAGSVA
jgi:hypothetical protein